MIRRHSAFWAALLFGFALFVIRVAGATTRGDILFAAALTLAEFSIVGLWEKKTSQLAEERLVWEQDEVERGRRKGLSEAAAANLDYRQKALEQSDEKVLAFENELDRDHLLSDQKALLTIASNAVRGGYYAGISANAGAISGATGWLETAGDRDQTNQEETSDEGK